jgi:hypothetical protein
MRPRRLCLRRRLESAFIPADYTHSLVGAWGRRTGVVLGLVSFSHWLLDLIVHRHDMPVLPGNAGHLPRLGFGLWQILIGGLLVLALDVTGILD